MKFAERLKIIKRYKNGLSVFQLAKKFRKNPSTIYRVLALKKPKIASNDTFKISKKLLQFENYLDKRVRKDQVFNGQKLFSELKKQDYSGSYATLNRYLKKKLQNTKPGREYNRFETQPGEQAQVDWGTFGKIEMNGRLEILYCFVYILGYSRMIYIEFVVRQNLQTLLNCHLHAFEQLGIPNTIVYDNMKTVVIGREKVPGSKPVIMFNPKFLSFSRHYIFQIYACPPYYPQAKGKVESGVKYVRNNFMQGMKQGKTFKDLDDLNQQASDWVKNIANVRIHSTTGKEPNKLWLREKSSLKGLQDFQLYDTACYFIRHSSKDALITHRWNFYEVPKEYTRLNLLVKEISERGIPKIEIYFENDLIWIHTLNPGRGEWVTIDQPSSHKSKRKFFNYQNLTEKMSPGDISIKSFSRPLGYYEQFI